MNTEIIQFIPRPNRDDVQTDFPTIVFHSAVPDPAITLADAAADQHAELERRES